MFLATLTGRTSDSLNYFDFDKYLDEPLFMVNTSDLSVRKNKDRTIDCNGIRLLKTCQATGLLLVNGHALKNVDKIMSDLFVFRCQKCSIGKLIFYAGGEYKILHRQFFDGNTHQNSNFNKKKVSEVEGSEIVGLKIFRSNSQAGMIFITYTHLKCLLKMSS